MNSILAFKMATVNVKNYDLKGGTRSGDIVGRVADPGHRERD